MSDTEDLVQERHGDTVLLRLNRPSRRNALTVSLVASLASAVRDAVGSGARALVLTGEGVAFCAGGDLDDLAGVAEEGALAVTQVIYGNFHALVRALAESPLPVVAAVNGPALGAGLDLALSCDVRVASREAVFASSWLTMGLVPGMGGAHLLVAAIGATRAAKMLLTADRVPAEQALEWGLVTELAAPDEVLPAALTLAERIGAHSPAAVAATKAAYRRAAAHALADELATLGATQGALLTGEDFTAAAAKFRRPRP